MYERRAVENVLPFFLVASIRGGRHDCTARSWAMRLRRELSTPNRGLGRRWVQGITALNKQNPPVLAPSSTYLTTQLESDKEGRTQELTLDKSKATQNIRTNIFG
mmetsp:Transcript_12744/g.19112  ORF Transcript_12744/g.19112 Transcript_12744/m.19112 type:complete len:105 (+) Transcript_12744:30-344(+)